MWRTLVRCQYLLIVASATHIFASEQTDLMEEDLQSAEPRQRCSLVEHELDRRHVCVMSFGWQVCLVWPARKERLPCTTAQQARPFACILHQWVGRTAAHFIHGSTSTCCLQETLDFPAESWKYAWFSGLAVALRSRQDGKAKCRKQGLPIEVLVAAPDESDITAVFADGTRHIVPNLTVGDVREAIVKHGRKRDLAVLWELEHVVSHNRSFDFDRGRIENCCSRCMISSTISCKCLFGSSAQVQ